jgi:hypothetical protein
MLELLRIEQGESQISQQKDGENQRDCGDNVNVHGGLPQLLAGLDVEKRQDEEDYSEGEHDCILHFGSHSSGRPVTIGLSPALGKPHSRELGPATMLRKLSLTPQFHSRLKRMWNNLRRTSKLNLSPFDYSLI